MLSAAVVIGALRVKTSSLVKYFRSVLFSAISSIKIFKMNFEDVLLRKTLTI